MAALPAYIDPDENGSGLHWENGLLVIPLAQARTRLGELAQLAEETKDRIILTRDGQRIAAIVPIEDADLIEELEDRADFAAAERALAEGGERIPWDVVKQELGL
jgi:prevent-host-death family protein